MTVALKNGRKIECVQIYLGDDNITLKVRKPGGFRFIRAAKPKDVEYISGADWELERSKGGWRMVYEDEQE